MKALKKNNINIIMVGFNENIDQRVRTDTVGSFGLGISNERGGRLYVVRTAQTQNHIIFTLEPG